MPRMIDLIRTSAVPANLMQSAARGALAVPAPEMIEILVHLAIHSKIFGERASLTLAGWDETSSKAAAANPETPKEVLEYLVSPQNLRPVLLEPLLGNPSVAERSLAKLAGSASPPLVDVMLKHERANGSGLILSGLAANPNLSETQSSCLKEKLAGLSPDTKARAAAAGVGAPATTVEAASHPTADSADDEGVAAFLSEHASEISAEADKPFQPIGAIHEESAADSEEPIAVKDVESVPGAPAGKKTILTADEQRGSALQKISRLNITGRIQLAMKGTKEERSLLIRDGTKIVALAVLESPKISDGEVEKFASQKNVLEAVLRAIPLKRRFMKNYNIVRNLVFNPRTPIDLSLTLMKNLLVGDLKNLAGNKEVSDTVRKLALRVFRQKSEAGKRKE